MPSVGLSLVLFRGLTGWPADCRFEDHACHEKDTRIGTLLGYMVSFLFMSDFAQQQMCRNTTPGMAQPVELRTRLARASAWTLLTTTQIRLAPWARLNTVLPLTHDAVPRP